MKPYLRVTPYGAQALDERPIKYQEALVKLIPSEVVALYLGGKNAIEAYFGGAPPDADLQPFFRLGWIILCLIGLLIFRRWATSDIDAGIPPEWPAIILAAMSLLVWIYSFGDVFKIALKIWHPLLATLLVLGWTFTVPLIYRRIVGSTPGAS